MCGSENTEKRDCKGRGFSEVFGEDYSENGAKMAYFFREQAALALDAAPEFVYINGWNEFTTVRNADHSGLKNAFIDLFDDENSRDFEPTKGFLKDDYYLLQYKYSRGIYSHETALYLHGYTDRIQDSYCMTFPRGYIYFGT